jgi:hypothetical protein
MSSWLRREKDPVVAAQKKLEKEAKAIESLRSLLQSDAGATAAQQLVQGEPSLFFRGVSPIAVALAGYMLNPFGAAAGSTTMAPAWHHVPFCASNDRPAQPCLVGDHVDTSSLVRTFKTEAALKQLSKGDRGL